MKLNLFSVLTGLILLIISISFPSSGLAKKEKTSIRLLNWWSYLDGRVVDRIRKEGANLDVSIYQSNEVALARLLSKRDLFDIAIVSNINLDVLLKQNIFDTEILKKTVDERDYFKLVTLNSNCVPYMWGTTIFAYDSRTSQKPPRTLKELEALKRDGFTIGVLDDPFEMAARILGDNLDQCKNKSFINFFSNINTCGKAFSEARLGFLAKEFMTSSDDFLKRDKVAAYSWQGSVFMNLKKSPWLKFNLSQNHPVIGADYVCVLKNRGSKKAAIDKVIKIVEILTDRKSTEYNMETNQYFSPYVNHKTGLHESVSAMYDKLVEQIKTSEPVFLTTPSENEHREINKWWKKVRYENQ